MDWTHVFMIILGFGWGVFFTGLVFGTILIARKGIKR